MLEREVIMTNPAVSMTKPEGHVWPFKARKYLAFFLALVFGGICLAMSANAVLAGSGLAAFFWLMPLPFILWAIFYPKWTLACLAALIFWLPGPIDHFWDIRVSLYPTADLVRFLSLLDVLVVMAWLWLPRVRDSKLRAAEFWVGILLFALTAYSACNVLWQSDRLDLVRSQSLWVGLLPLRLLIVYCLARKAIHRLEDVYRLYLGSAIGVVGLLANSAYKTLLGESMAGRVVAGTFGNNVFSVLLALMIVLLQMLRKYLRIAWLRWAITGLQLICFVFILFSDTRMAFGLLVLGLGMLFLLQPRYSTGFVARVTLSVVLAVLVLGVLFLAVGAMEINTFDRVALLLKVVSGQASAQETSLVLGTANVRLVFWQFALDRLAESPWFGIGPGQWNYERVSSDNRHLFAPNGQVDAISDPHNGFVYMAVEYGWPSLAMYGGVLLICILVGTKAMRQSKALLGSWPDARQVYDLTTGLLVIASMLVLGHMTNTYINSLYTQIFIGLIFFTLLRMGTVLRNEYLYKKQPE